MSKNGKPKPDPRMIELLEKQGLHYTAEYLKKFNDGGNPWFANGLNNREIQETFYKKCVEEGHPWSYYDDPPPKNVIL